MYRSFFRRARWVVGLSLAATLCATPLPASADSGTGSCGADHSVASDPRPGDPLCATSAATTTATPMGLTDAQLKQQDPRAYRQIMAERPAIERALKARVHRTLDAKGLRYGRTLTPDQQGRVSAALEVNEVSPYGYLRFGLVPGSGSWAYNGYKGTLYFVYGIYYASTDIYKWYTVSWPAISGSNRPADQSKVGYGPIPEYTYDFGFMNTVFQGYVPDGRDAFYPGKWRLDPWSGAPYGRSQLETHGGRNANFFRPTSGCIRITPASISALKTYYDSKMANKRNRSTAHLSVNY